MSAVKINTTKDKVWQDASGQPVPIAYISKANIKQEALAGKVLKYALAAEQALYDLHVFMTAAFSEARQWVAEEFELKNKRKKEFGKGGFTWYSFDKSVKIEATVDEIVKWDAALMTEAYEELQNFIGGSLNQEQEFIKGLVVAAFKSGNGGIDTKQVFQLLKHEGKTTNKHYRRACELIRQAQGVDKTKLYMRVWEKIENGQYRNVRLNFHSI